MIHVIMGLKGSGKTKKLIDAINDASLVRKTETPLSTARS